MQAWVGTHQAHKAEQSMGVEIHTPLVVVEGSERCQSLWLHLQHSLLSWDEQMGENSDEGMLQLLMSPWGKKRMILDLTGFVAMESHALSLSLESDVELGLQSWVFWKRMALLPFLEASGLSSLLGMLMMLLLSLATFLLSAKSCVLFALVQIQIHHLPKAIMLDILDSNKFSRG